MKNQAQHHEPNKDLHAFRFVHLLGGLQAFDLGDPEVTVGLDGLANPLRFTRPPYPALYGVLSRQLGLQPVGVQFIAHKDEANGLMPTEWFAWNPSNGLSSRTILQEWSQVRTTYARRKDEVATTLARKIGTYLRLLNFRLYQVSAAYHAMLRFQVRRRKGDPPVKPGLFRSLWREHVDAGLHAFLADAASLRDALSEGAWRLVLKREHSVTTMSELMKRAKGDTHPLILEMITAGQDGGWIKNLTDLRNEIVHVVPLAGAQEHHFSELRELAVAGGNVPQLHCPLTTSDWKLRRPTSRWVDYADLNAVKKSVEEYREFAKESGDALEYCWRTVNALMLLAEQVRLTAGLQGEVLKLTEGDFIEPPRIIRD